ncbi:MAG: exodeoxyribonuclease V subunit gamma [Gemmatimonadota bacterium]|nr:exodeoxyribonuclease V subunit gamma [Gemmatimonadota bacterium]
MGELTLIYGPAHPDKISPAYERCLASLDAGDGESFLWLFPTHFQAQLMRRQLSRASRTGLLTGHLALDLNSFTDILYSLCPERRAALPLSAQRLLVEDALAASATSAPYYSRQPERLSRGLTQLFRRLEETGTQPSDLGETTQRSAELQALYAAYLERLADGWSGSRERFIAVDTHLDHSTLAQRFPDLGLLVLCGFVEMPAPFLPVLDKLLALVPESIALLDYDPEGPRFFARTRPLYEFLRARAIRVERSAADQYPAAAFADRLFTHSRASLDSPVERVACPDRAGEVTAMARRIRQLHQEQGVELAQIRISFRNLDTYAELVAEVLPRHGLPFYITRGRPLATAPAMNTVFALIDAVLERYSRAALFRLLSSPLVQLRYSFSDQTRTLAAEDFAAWTRNVPPSTGRDTWLAAIEGNFAYLESELGRESEPFSEDIDDFPTRREDLRAELEALQPLRAGLTALFDLLQPLESRQDLPAFRHHLLHALGALGVEDALADGTVEDGQALARFLDLLDELCAPAAALQPRTLSQFADLLRDAISQAHVPAATRAGIQVTDLAAAGSAPCDYLFIGGLVQGEFPRLPPADIFLEETQRRTLNLDDDATTEAERLLFYRAICSPRRGLGVFYPKQSGSEMLAPSPFIDELDGLLAPQPETEESNGTPGTLAELHLALGRGLCATSKSDSAREGLALYSQAAQLDGHATALRHLVRGLHLAELRTASKSFGSHEGVLDEAPLIDKLRTRLGAGHSFSATQLELYGRCPFRFFAQELLNLQPLRDPEDDDSARKRGNLVHRTLYRFYATHGEAAERAENLAENIAELRRQGRQVAEEMSLTGFFWERELERLLGSDDGERKGVLPHFLRLQAAAANPAVPTHFELSFGSYPGMGEGDPQSTTTLYAIDDPETGSEVRIAGKIDRIDRTADGCFIVFDYKTGRMPSVADIDTGLNLQLPLYLLAAESLFEELELRQGAGAAYLMLRDLEDCGRSGLFADATHRNTAYVASGRYGIYDHEAYRQRLDAVRGFVLSYTRAMRRGIFRVTTHDPAKICPHCPYQQSCRLDPQRMRALS